MEIIIAGTNPAAVGGTERYNGLSGKIIRFQKCADNSGGLSMPNRITKKNNVILSHVFYFARDCRAGVWIILLLVCPTICVIRQIFFCVGIFWYNLVEVSVQNICGILCQRPGRSCCGEIRNQNAVATAGRFGSPFQISIQQDSSLGTS